MNFHGKKVAIIGLGVSNQALLGLLLKEGATISARDRKEKEQLGDIVQRLESQGIEMVLGEDYLSNLTSYDMIFITPGMKKNLPELEAASRAGVKVLSEMEVFFDRCKAPIIGVTGSAGKTTTTTLIGEMLKLDGRRPVYVGGNIGRPLVGEVESIPPEAVVVLELSSFQLQTLSRSPHISVITNIRPNHLDIHSSMDEYIKAKRNIVRFQDKDDLAVLNGDDQNVMGFAAGLSSEPWFFRRKGKVERGGYISGDSLVLRDGAGSEQKICKTSEIKLPGGHNHENLLAAFTAAFLSGASLSAMREVALTFEGVEHRLELVRELDGVKYYNDSIATSPDRTMAALNTLSGPIILIAGGYDKHLDYTELGEVVADRVKAVLTLGATAPRIEDAIKKAMDGRSQGPVVIRCKDLQEAVERAADLSLSGDNVLLSPASASYDMFKNFEERGQRFKEMVNRLR